MASRIQIKRGTGSAVPSGLLDGELAINLDSGQLYFGSGSNSENNFYFNNITASGDISLADNKKLVLGDKAGGDGNIKHSGTNLQIAETTGNIQITNYKTDGDIVFSTDDGSGGETAYLTLDGGDVSTTIHTNITASGDISASGNIMTAYSVTGSSIHSTTNYILQGDSIIGNFLGSHLYGNANFPMVLNGTQINLGFGDIPIIATGDVRLTGDIQLGNATSDRVSISGSLFAGSHVTASGNISASGDIINTGNIITNEITASGNISAANIHLPSDGDITFDDTSTSDQFITGRDNYIIVDGDDIVHIRADDYVNLDSVSTLATDITASGNISASLDITTSNNMSCNSMTANRFIGGTRSLSQTAQTATASLAQGDIYYAESSVSTVAGKIYALLGNGNQVLADKDNEMYSSNLIGVAIGSAGNTDGYLLRGMVKMYSDPFTGDDANSTIGQPVYLGDDGLATGSISGHATDDFIKIVGHSISGSGVIYFNPDNTFIKKA